MSTKFFDILVAKDFEVFENGKPSKKTKWNRVGTAWPAKSGNSMLFELFMYPGPRFLINLKEPDQNDQADSEEAPF